MDAPERDPAARNGALLLALAVGLHAATAAALCALPLYLIALVLGVVALTRGETAWGLAVVVGALLLPAVLVPFLEGLGVL